MSDLARIALIHDWLTEWGGSEDVLRAMLRCVPGATLWATIDFLSEDSRRKLGAPHIRTSFLQRAPWVRRRFWNYLPLTPLAVESMDLSDADLVLSSSHAFAKGVLITANQLHISYVHSPMRYAWDLQHQYLRDYRLDRGLKGLLARWMFQKLRAWDRLSANGVDLFIANSHHVRQRIWRVYRRPAKVIYPPVRLGEFPKNQGREDFYLTVSRLVSYKRVDLIVEAFAAMPGRRLIVIGDGPEAAALRARCPANVTLMGWQSDEIVRRHMGIAKAFVFAAHEDFGISPVEAQACGTPVIAYGVGGATETVRDVRQHAQPTGVLFPEQTTRSLIEAVDYFESRAESFNAEVCREWAEHFSEERFHHEFSAFVERAWVLWREQPQRIEALMMADA